MPDVIERRKLSELVTERIQQYILDHGLRPGDRLPTEQELADRFGVSRNSTREATKALGFLGIIDAAPRRGLAVGQVNMKRVTSYLGFHLALCDLPKAQLLDSRIVIETGALPHVMRCMEEDPTLHERLTELANRVGRARDLEARIEADVAFHHALLQATGLQPLIAFQELLTVFFNRMRAGLTRTDWQTGMAEHYRILDALRDGDLKKACAVLTAHLEGYRKLKLA
jgi:GntR family transcriptional regulator, transcriptional repressor for pyruvate dehydrogenase complex